MKLSILTLVFLVFNLSSFSQSFEEDELNLDELPAVVIKKVGVDFSYYLPDRNADNKVREMQKKFIGYKLGKDYEGHDEYLVLMEADDAYLAATYDEKGKLMRVVEKYENVKLPRQVIFSVYKSFPEWTIVKDKYLYTQEDGDIKKKQYNLKIKKGNEIKKIVVQSNGTIVSGV
ncbi:MAG: hypothetical protein V4670_10025 [Bacteroidota bacterium]